MKQKTTTPTPSSKTHTAWMQYLLAALLLAALLLIWRELAITRQSLTQLQERNTSLSGELKAAKAELDQLNSGDSSIQTRERLATTRSAPGGKPVEEEMETLFLQAPTVEKSSDGLTVRFGFEPETDTELPASIVLVVRVPGSSTSRIVALKAVGSSEVAPIVNTTGKLGMIEATPAELKTLSFELTVTDPVKATVRGSKGIIDFELDISPDGCAVRKL